jgi:ubiquinone/menaquinone biosynthesis C-methylase UbiE
MPMKPDPDYDEYYKKWAKAYNNSNYDKGLAARMMRQGHISLEKLFSSHDFFSSVLEIGAGSGVHFQFVQHSFDEYVMTDGSNLILNSARSATAKNSKGKITYLVENAVKLSFSDAQFDRVIATHVLEHVPNPHEVLREWARVLKPGGVLSLLQPCDPGMFWRLGRHLGPRASATKAGIEYDYWMAREHINSINNLVSILHYYFDNIEERWYPFGLPSTDLNLFYACHVTI